MRRVAETGSTNTDLAVLARAGEPAGAVLVTDHQTAGKGRLGRVWDDTPGASLLVSILFRPPWPPDEWHRLTQAVAVAAVLACRDTCGLEPSLKWPNDLLVGDRKLAGILAETAGPDAVVVGMGMNLNWDADRLHPGATSLAVECGHPVGRDDVLDALLAHLGATDWDGLHGAYRARLATLGRQVRVELPDGELIGVAADVAADGRLVVAAADGRNYHVAAGDVVHLRPAGA